MAWRIHSWADNTGRGSVKSPHYGPFDFGPEANIDGIVDFEVGEDVAAEFNGAVEDGRVISVRLFRRRQPPGTECPELGSLSGRYGELQLEELTDSTVQLWYGDCCGYCTPEPIRLRYEGVSRVLGLDEDTDLDEPRFRRATAAEMERCQLRVRPGETMYCIEPAYGPEREDLPVIIVARSVSVTNVAERGGEA